MDLGLHYATILPYIGAILVALGLAGLLAGKEKAEKILAYGLTALVVGWFIYMIPFVRLDFTLAEVARNSNNDLPLSIRIATSWSGGGGSLYLYTTLIAASILTVLIPYVRSNRELPRTFLIVSGSVVLVAFASALLNGAFDVNPKGVGGLGLNPLLKNLWIIPHPLTTFGGYALLLSGSLIAVFTGSKRRGLGIFTVGWSMLTLGIMFGAIWSYETFGWGGYWAWDPVEISELSVWLVATAALHMLGPLSPIRKGMLLATASSALFAPFVTRSGLSPLHSFAAADIGSAILLVAGIVMLGVAIYDISNRIGSVKIKLRPSGPGDLANLSILMAGTALAIIAFFVYASLIVPGVLNVLGREATVPTMKQGVEFYHPVLLPLFLFSLVWLPGYFLAKKIGVKGFTALVVTEIVLSIVLLIAVRSGSMDILPGAPYATKLQVAVALPVALLTLSSIIISIIDSLRGKIRPTILRDLGLKILHTGMLITFIGVLISGTYAFNDTFFQTYTIYPDKPTDAGIITLTINNYKYTPYNGTIDLKNHLSNRAFTAGAAWLGLSLLSQDIAVAVQEIEFARTQILQNNTLKELTDIIVNKTLFHLNNTILNVTANINSTNITTRVTQVLARNASLSLAIRNATLIITVTPVTGQQGGLAGAWVVSGIQAEKLIINNISIGNVRIGFHSPLSINMTSPAAIKVDNLTLSIYSFNIYPMSNTTSVVVNENTTTINNVFLEIANATLHLSNGSIRIPVPTGPGYYLLISLLQGQIPDLQQILSCRPLVEVLTNTTILSNIVGQQSGELPLLPENAPSGIALDLILTATIGGEQQTINTRIRFEANGEAMGIHGLVTPAVLVRKGLGDIYVSIHPPMIRAASNQYHEPLVKYINVSINRLPPGEALTLTAVMVGGYNINALSNMDPTHAAFLMEQGIVDLYTIATNSTDAIRDNGIVVMIKYVPAVNLVWIGVTLMALTGFLLGALYLRSSAS